MFRQLGNRWRTLAAASAVVGVLGITLGIAVAWGNHDGSGGTLHVCVNPSGAIRTSAICRTNEQPYILSTEAGVAALRSALETADIDLRGRLSALEAADGTHTARVAALEAASTAQSGQLGVLQNASLLLGDRVAALEARLQALEQAVLTATFTKVFDGGHYASYNVRGTGLLAGSMVVSGVGITATVEENGTFSVFGGNLFCAEDVMIFGTDANGSAIARTAPVECNSEMVSLATARFTKVFDGGHYASYQITGRHFRPGSSVVSGVGLTAAVGEDGTFSVFGGNLFCHEEVSVSGSDWLGTPVTRSATVVCNNE
jgi:hypothetical protein